MNENRLLNAMRNVQKTALEVWNVSMVLSCIAKRRNELLHKGYVIPEEFTDQTGALPKAHLPLDCHDTFANTTVEEFRSVYATIVSRRSSGEERVVVDFVEPYLQYQRGIHW